MPISVDGAGNPYDTSRLSDAPRQRTPRGSCHILYRQHGVKLRNSHRLVRPESRHASGRVPIVAFPATVLGKRYTWKVPQPSSRSAWKGDRAKHSRPPN
jgi:hypothetical protein